MQVAGTILYIWVEYVSMKEFLHFVGCQLKSKVTHILTEVNRKNCLWHTSDSSKFSIFCTIFWKATKKHIQRGRDREGRREREADMTWLDCWWPGFVGFNNFLTRMYSVHMQFSPIKGDWINSLLFRYGFDLCLRVCVCLRSDRLFYDSSVRNFCLLTAINFARWILYVCVNAF